MAAFSDFLEDAIVNGLFRSATASTWAASTAYAVGDVVFPTSSNGFVYECVTAGTSGSSEPTWPTTLGQQVTDGTVTWEARQVPGRCLKRPLYFALFTAAPSDSGGGTEVSGGSYARVQYDPSDSNWSAPSGGNGQTQNSNAITFPTATADWGTVVAVGVFDASTGGNLLVHGSLTTSKTVQNGDTAKFDPNNFTLTVD